MRKARVTISVDPELADAAGRAVAEGRAASVSAWVNEALAEKVGRDERLAALAAAVASYEDEHGLITAEELAEQRRADADAAAGARVRPRPRRGRTRAAG